MSTATNIDPVRARPVGTELRRRLERRFGPRLKGMWRIDEEPIPEKTGYDLHYAVVISEYGSSSDKGKVIAVFADFNEETQYDPSVYLWAVSEADYEEGWHDTARAIRREGRSVR